MFRCFAICAFLSLMHYALAELQLSKALSGTTLRCCVIHQPPIVYMDPMVYSNNGISGVITNHLREMQALLGWQCSSIVSYTEGNGTSFNVFVDMMRNCTENGSIRNDPRCPCDIGIGGWFPTAERRQVIDLLPAFVFDDIRVSYHVSSTFLYGEDLFFLTTFDLRTWACIFSLIVLFALAKLVDRGFVPVLTEQSEEEDGTRSYKAQCWPFHQHEWNFERVGEAVKSTMGRIMLQSGSDHQGSACHSWLLNLTLGICGLFIVLSYEARMTALLVQEEVVSEFRSVEDFRTCRIRPEQVCVPGGSFVETFWNETIATGECHKGAQAVRGSFDEILEAVENGTCKFGLLLDSTIKSAMHGKYCGRILKSEVSLYTAGLSMVVPKDSPLTESMSLATLVLRNQASNPSLEEFFDSISECDADTENDMMFTKLRVFFVMAFAACGVLLIISFVERVRNKKPRKRLRSKQQMAMNAEDKAFAY